MIEVIRTADAVRSKEPMVAALFSQVLKEGDRLLFASALLQRPGPPIAPILPFREGGRQCLYPGQYLGPGLAHEGFADTPLVHASSLASRSGTACRAMDSASARCAWYR